jgi:peptidoglycan/LPS O-acetylase OafA/YrhL
VAGDAKGPPLARGVLAALGLVSSFWLNRRPDLDHFAIYFLGSYALGLLVAWVQAGAVRPGLALGYLILVALALTLDFRSRLVVATATALALLWGHRAGWVSQWPRSRAVDRLARWSYSLFLVHFPVCLVVNAWWSRHVPTDPWLSLLGMTAAYGASLVAAVAFYHGVERRVVGVTVRGR